MEINLSCGGSVTVNEAAFSNAKDYSDACDMILHVNEQCRLEQETWERKFDYIVAKLTSDLFRKRINKKVGGYIEYNGWVKRYDNGIPYEASYPHGIKQCKEVEVGDILFYSSDLNDLYNHLYEITEIKPILSRPNGRPFGWVVLKPFGELEESKKLEKKSKFDFLKFWK